MNETADRGALLWLITLGSIGVWLVHVGVEVSLVTYSRTHHWARWLMEGVTVGLALLAALSVLMAARVVARHRQDEAHISADGRIAFMGRLGVFVGSCTVALILVEGMYIVVIRG